VNAFRSLSRAMFLGFVRDRGASITNLIILPMAFLGGAFIPLNFAPAWLQDVSYAMPLRYLVLGAAAVLTLISVRVFRWDQI
jgi:ABC-type multidrug transport system permease subunit